MVVHEGLKSGKTVPNEEGCGNTAIRKIRKFSSGSSLAYSSPSLLLVIREKSGADAKLNVLLHETSVERTDA